MATKEEQREFGVNQRMVKAEAFGLKDMKTLPKKGTVFGVLSANTLQQFDVHSCSLVRLFAEVVTFFLLGTC